MTGELDKLTRQVAQRMLEDTSYDEVVAVVVDLLDEQERTHYGSDMTETIASDVLARLKEATVVVKFGR